jgi:uncharacterized YkwD family protein
LKRFKKIVLTGTLLLSSIGLAGVVSAAPCTVSDNDTMWTISQKYGIDLMSLIQANTQVENPNIIWSGMELIIPDFGLDLPDPSQSTPAPSQSTPAPSQSTPAPSQSTPIPSDSTFESQVTNLVNQERAKAGLGALESDSSLSAMALDKAKDMYNNHYFDHTSPTYGSPFDMMNSYGIRYSYAGENIAMGQRTPEEVMTAWMNSSGHRQNILNANYTKIGVAYYNGEWVQEFISN